MRAAEQWGEWRDCFLKLDWRMEFEEEERHGFRSRPVGLKVLPIKRKVNPTAGHLTLEVGVWSYRGGRWKTKPPSVEGVTRGERVEHRSPVQRSLAAVVSETQTD